MPSLLSFTKKEKEGNPSGHPLKSLQGREILCREENYSFSPCAAIASLIFASISSVSSGLSMRSCLTASRP